MFVSMHAGPTMVSCIQKSFTVTAYPTRISMNNTDNGKITVIFEVNFEKQDCDGELFSFHDQIHNNRLIVLVSYGSILVSLNFDNGDGHVWLWSIFWIF